MVSIESKGEILTFKRQITLEQFSRAMRQFNALYKLFAGRSATYNEFTAWLIACDFVDRPNGNE